MSLSTSTLHRLRSFLGPRAAADLEAGLGGGGADLSNVDQDINVLNEHPVNLAGDLGADADGSASLRWDEDLLYGIVVESTLGNGETDIYVVKPGDLDTWARLTSSGSGSMLVLRHGGQQAQLQAMTLDGGGAFDAPSIVFGSGLGPVLHAPDGSFHRIVVANDGTLSTVPATLG